MHLSRLHRSQSHRRWDQGISENPSSQSMTHDTYDTCFHKIFSRAHAGKTYIYFKKKIIKEKVIKTRCHICHVSHLSHESTYHKWTTHHLEHSSSWTLIILNTHHLEPLIILNHSSSWTTHHFEPLIILNHSSSWTTHHLEPLIILNTNNANNTNILSTRISLCSRRCAHMRNESHEYFYFAHGSHSANASHGSRISFLICHLKHNKSITTTSQ